MIEIKRNPDLSGSPTKGPPIQLFIYWLEGNIDTDEQILGEHFIGYWAENDDSFLFFSTPSDSQVKQLLNSQPQLTLRDKYNMPYAQWLGEAPRTLRIGRFLISPPWERVDSAEDGLNIILDPGVVFGTGTHPTTRDCIEALELTCHVSTIDSVLDLGTGTGLLSLAAARLGCSRILAVDMNLLAVKTANNNIRLNRLEDRILSVQGKAEECIACHADLVLANIHHAVMMQILNSDYLYHKKYVILSGLLRSQADDVVDKLAKQHVNIIKKWTKDGIWHTFLGKVS